DKKPQRQQIDLFETPDYLLQADGIAKFGERREPANLHNRLIVTAGRRRVAVYQRYTGRSPNLEKGTIAWLLKTELRCGGANAGRPPAQSTSAPSTRTKPSA